MKFKGNTSDCDAVSLIYFLWLQEDLVSSTNNLISSNSNSLPPLFYAICSNNYFQIIFFKQKKIELWNLNMVDLFSREKVFAIHFPVHLFKNAPNFHFFLLKMLPESLEISPYISLSSKNCFLFEIPFSKLSSRLSLF